MQPRWVAAVRLALGLVLILTSCSFDRPGSASATATPADADVELDAAVVEVEDAALIFDAATACAPDSGIADSGITDAGVLDAEPGFEDAGEPPLPACTVTLCIAATGARDEGANATLAEVCRQAPGNLEDCGLLSCDPIFAAYRPTRAFDALFERLDTNADDAIDGLDESCLVQIVGYSWGGGDALEVVTRYLEDARVAMERKHIETLVLLVPYRPFRETMDIPDAVAKHWTYRHTVAPASDCTASVIGGPFLGLGPTCAATTTCIDYDYSADVNAVYHGMTQDWGAEEIDHCTISDAAGLAMLHNLISGTNATGTPPELPVPQP